MSTVSEGSEPCEWSLRQSREGEGAGGVGRAGGGEEGGGGRGGGGGGSESQTAK